MKNETSTSISAAPEQPGDEMLNKKQLAAKLKVTVRTIENWQAGGLLPYIKISSVVLFHWPDILEHLNTNFRVCRRGSFRSQRGLLTHEL